MNLSNSLLDLRPLGKGLAYPIRVSDATGDLATAEGVENVLGCIELIITTPVGTRQNMEDFGTVLNSLLFESTRAAADVLPTALIEAVRRWEPRVKEITATATPFEAEGRVDVLLSCKIKATGQTLSKVYPYYLGKGI